MAIFSSKHKDQEHTFPLRSFSDGLNEEVSPAFLSATSLSQCMNMKYAVNKSVDGTLQVVLKKRQGTTIISTAALPSAADVKACTYYMAGAKYILATATKIYYLDGDLEPVEIGTDELDGIPTFTEFKGKLIIHDSGVTKAWNGTDSSLETLAGYYVDEIIGTGGGIGTVDYSGTLDHPAVKSATLVITYTDTTTKTITCNAAGTLAGDVAAHELMPNTVDRDFSSASAWANVDLNAYDETTDLTITASAIGQYCTCPVASAPTTVGKRYRMTFAVANIVATWTVKSYDGTQTIGTVTANGAQSFDWTATTTGGYRIVAVATTSSGDFDNFTLTTNVLDHTTGVFSFRCSGSPDDETPIYATYENAIGAPKSKAGFVRANRLYMWGDSDNSSRLWYSGPNDEDGWDTSSSGGYIDIDPLDGYSLVGCLNYFQSLILIKGNSIHRLNNFPGDTVFRVEPLLTDVGSVAYLTCLNDGSIVSFLSPEGWLGLETTVAYGDIQKTTGLSTKFHTDAVKYANSGAYADYNQTDKQLWISLYDGSAQLSYIHVLDVGIGGQLSHYRFAFGHSCFKYVNGEMLIGGIDGNLYKLVDDDSVFTDNSVSYASDTYFRSSFIDFKLSFNRKHNKRYQLHAYGSDGMTANIDFYKDYDYFPFISETVSFTGSAESVGNYYINPAGSNYYIYDLTSVINDYIPSPPARRKFNYRSIMYGVKDIEGTGGAEIYGIDLVSAIIGA